MTARPGAAPAPPHRATGRRRGAHFTCRGLPAPSQTSRSHPVGRSGSRAPARQTSSARTSAWNGWSTPHDPELLERYATLRAHKGIMVDVARDVVVDVSYFGRMMVLLRLADGMVSGSEHTTAHTIRPAFEVIRACAGVSIVSS